MNRDGEPLASTLEEGLSPRCLGPSGSSAAGHAHQRLDTPTPRGLAGRLADGAAALTSRRPLLPESRRGAKVAGAMSVTRHSSIP